MNNKRLSKLYFNFDLPAGIVVFLVALPLCLGIALASGAPFFSGMISGVIGGIIIGSISSSHTSVSGPAAGLVSIVLAAVATLGSFQAFLLAVALAGVIQIVMGVLKIGSIAEYFPNAVIRGMLTAIGLIIIIKQIPHAFGYDKDVAFLSEEVTAQSLDDIFFSLFHIHTGATIICAISLAIMILWEMPITKKFNKKLPGSLVAVITGTLISELIFSGSDALLISASHKVSVPVSNNFGEFLGLFMLPDFSQLSNPDIYVVAFTLAIVASIETLLCIEAADKLDKQRRVTSTSQELLAQGTGNLFSGLIGGLPITSVIVRTSANIEARAKTKLSTITHGFLLLITVIVIPTLLNKIPLSALAAILLVVGYKLAKPSIFISFFKKGFYQFLPFMVTVISILLTDLLVGVACGLALSLFIVLKRNLKNSYFFHKENYKEGDKIMINLSDEVSFLNKASIRRTLDYLPGNSTVIIDAERSYYIDDDVLDIINEFRDIKAPQRNIKCKTIGFKEKYGIDNTHFVEVEKNIKPF